MIMKKTYKKPVMTVLTIKQTLLQTASLPKGDSEGPIIGDNDEVLSRERRGGFWDDEE